LIGSGIDIFSGIEIKRKDVRIDLRGIEEKVFRKKQRKFEVRFEKKDIDVDWDLLLGLEKLMLGLGWEFQVKVWEYLLLGCC
jgi:hypothetical protein